MNSLRQWLRKVFFFLRRDKFDRDLQEEMAFHREQSARDLESDGASSDAAHYAANRQFGNPPLLRDRSRDMISFGFETALQDFRFAFRQLRKNLGFATNAILILALGMCAAVSIFGFVDAALLKPLPYRDPARLVAVYESGRSFPRSNVSYQDFLDWTKRNRVFSSLAAWGGDGGLDGQAQKRPYTPYTPHRGGQNPYEIMYTSWIWYITYSTFIGSVRYVRSVRALILHIFFLTPKNFD